MRFTASAAFVLDVHAHGGTAPTLSCSLSQRTLRLPARTGFRGMGATCALHCGLPDSHQPKLIERHAAGLYA